tara:strand:+ start:96 stop:617 length:522 start_codon:yes stop_codon:yes gene_type:complete
MNSMDISRETDQDTTENVIAIVLSFMENAVNDAGTYVEHSGRKIVSKKDINMALKAETFEYIHREDIEGSLLYYKEAIRNDFNDFNDDDDNDDDDDNSPTSINSINNINNKDDSIETFLQSKVVNDSEMDEYTLSMCKCNVCKRLNKAVAIWPDWKPETDMEHVLKRVIDTKL